MKRLSVMSLTAAAAAIAFATIGHGMAAMPGCDADNGGIKLPQGFCALVVADNVGPARHLTVAQNGDLFVALEDSRGKPGGIVALHDKDGDGRMDVTERFGPEGGTGIALRNGYLYFATTTAVMRYKMADGALKPGAPPEMIVADLPKQQEHADKTFAFDDKGGIYVNVGAPSNECQPQDRRRKDGRTGSMSAARETRRHLALRREPRTPETGRMAGSTRPGSGRWWRSPGTTEHCTRR